MNRNLLTQALIKFLAGIILTGLLVFLPAGSFAYWQGWLLMGILFIPMFLAGIVMLVKSPDLLSKRLNAKEKEGEQKAVVALSGLLFTLSFVTAGLNWRLNWWILPTLCFSNRLQFLGYNNVSTASGVDFKFKRPRFSASSIHSLE